MDDFAKQASSYQLDQEILDARGINMTVEEVAGLPTCKYSERVHSLHLSEDDLIFLKGLRRRIKNRLASQNSRRRSTEQLRRLARELRALRASRHAALAERRALLDARGRVRERCLALREYVVKVLHDRSDPSEVPALAPERLIPEESHSDTMSLPSPDTNDTEYSSPDTTYLLTDTKYSLMDLKRHLSDTKPLTDTKHILSDTKHTLADTKHILSDTKHTLTDTKHSLSDTKHILSDTKHTLTDTTYTFTDTKSPPIKDHILERDKHIFDFRIGKLVQQSVNHIYKEKKKVIAKTVFLDDAMKDMFDGSAKEMGDGEVLNLSLKRRSHGRKQTAPRRIACVYTDNNDGVLDLKIKKETQ